MEFENPAQTGYTIYTKLGCGFCTKAKDLLKSKNINFNLIWCDEYLLEARSEFLEFINNHAGKECKTFPMIFHNNKYIGGYAELVVYLDSHIQPPADDF